METPTGKAGTNYADDATADKLLQNESMVDFLARKGGLRLTKDLFSFTLSLACDKGTVTLSRAGPSKASRD